MFYRIQQVVTEEGHYITLPESYATLNAAVSALRSERKHGHQCRVVAGHVERLGVVYEPVDVPDPRSALALRVLNRQSHYVSGEEEDLYELDYTTRDGIAGLAVLIMQRANEDLPTPPFAGESDSLGMDGLRRMLHANGLTEVYEEGSGDSLLQAATLISKVLARPTPPAAPTP